MVLFSGQYFLFFKTDADAIYKLRLLVHGPMGGRCLFVKKTSFLQLNSTIDLSSSLSFFCEHVGSVSVTRTMAFQRDS